MVRVQTGRIWDGVVVGGRYSLHKCGPHQLCLEVFSRYGDVVSVKMDREGTTSQARHTPNKSQEARWSASNRERSGLFYV